MLIVGLIFLAFVVLFGLILLNAHLKNKNTPKSIVFLHGSVAFFAILVIIGYVVAGHTDSLLIAALTLFILAAIGGIFLFTMDIRKKPVPKLIILIHPLIGLSGIITVVIYVLQSHP